VILNIKKEDFKMAKRGGFPGGMGGFGGMNMNNIMKQAKKMQEEMQKSQEELSSKEFDSTAGGGAISVKVTGEKVLKEIKIKPEVVDPEDVEMLEDLILTCVNEALRKVDSAQSQEFGKFNIPGLM
jgi:DNA-binding protein, ybaB/ebfC family